jgi:hypothetical protein
MCVFLMTEMLHQNSSVYTERTSDFTQTITRAGFHRLILVISEKVISEPLRRSRRNGFRRANMNRGMFARLNEMNLVRAAYAVAFGLSPFMEY